MFSSTKEKEMLLRLYAKSRAIGHVPSFEEMDKMPDMPPANRFALHCRSYADAAKVVKSWLTAKPTTEHVDLSEEMREVMEAQDVRIRMGWIPICQRVTTKTLQDLLDEVMEQADEAGVLPGDFQVGYDLRHRLEQYD